MSTTTTDATSGMESQRDDSSQYVSFRVDGQLLGMRLKAS